MAGKRFSSRGGVVQDLSKFAQDHPAARLVAVAHSMGGLVMRHCLETSERHLNCVGDVVFLGTPHQGSVLAAEGDLLAALQLPAHSKEDFLRRLHEGLGEARVDLTPQSAFLRTLNARARPKGVRYHVAIGTQSFVTAEQSAEILDLLRRRLMDPDLSAGLRVRWQRVMEAPEWAPGQGDGAVSVTSAELPGAANVRQFQLNHLELKDLPGKKPQESPLFLWILEVVNHRETGEP